MRFGVCGGPECFDAIVVAGADYLEPPVAYFAVPEQPDSVWRENLSLLRGAGLTAEAWNCFLPGDLKIVGPRLDLPRYRRYVEVATARLAEAGAKVVVFGSGGARDIPVGYPVLLGEDEFAEAVEIASEAFCGAGITLAVEALRRDETNLLNRVEDAIHFVRGLDLPNVLTTADLFHMSVQGETPDHASVPGAIGHAHVADTDRTPPGKGMLDIGQFLQALSLGGYDGRVSIECGWKNFEREVGPALQYVRARWARVSGA